MMLGEEEVEVEEGGERWWRRWGIPTFLAAQPPPPPFPQLHPDRSPLQPAGGLRAALVEGSCPLTSEHHGGSPPTDGGRARHVSFGVGEGGLRSRLT